MSIRCLLALVLGLLALPVWSQAKRPCPPGEIHEHPGAWRDRPFPRAAGTFKAPPGSYSRPAANAVLDQIQALLRAADPQPVGTMAYLDRHLSFSSPDEALPRGYHLSVGFGGFYCIAAGTLHEYTESGVYLLVDVNSFDTTSLLVPVGAPEVRTLKGSRRLFTGEDGAYRVQGRRVYRIPAAAGTHRGVDHYTRHAYTREGATPDRQWFVVRKPGVPLFIPLTRRAYVAQFRDELQATMEGEIAILREVARQPGHPGNHDHEASYTRVMTAYLAAVDRYLAQSTEDELNRPVHDKLPFFPADTDQPTLRFDTGDRIMVTLNPAAFDPKLPGHVPQFIIVHLAAGHSRQLYERRVRDRITDGLDFAALQALIGR